MPEPNPQRNAYNIRFGPAASKKLQQNPYECRVMRSHIRRVCVWLWAGGSAPSLVAKKQRRTNGKRRKAIENNSNQPETHQQNGFEEESLVCARPAPYASLRTERRRATAKRAPEKRAVLSFVGENAHGAEATSATQTIENETLFARSGGRAQKRVGVYRTVYTTSNATAVAARALWPHTNALSLADRAERSDAIK